MRGIKEGGEGESVVNIKDTYKTYQKNVMFGIWIFIQTNQPQKKDMFEAIGGLEHELDSRWF